MYAQKIRALFALAMLVVVLFAPISLPTDEVVVHRICNKPSCKIN